MYGQFRLIMTVIVSLWLPLATFVIARTENFIVANPGAPAYTICNAPDYSDYCVSSTGDMANHYPVWQAYRIKDIGPYFRALPIRAYGWPQLRNLRDTGRLFVINRGDRKNRYAVFDTAGAGDRIILYDRYYRDRSGKIAFNQLDFNSFDALHLQDFRYAFWEAGDNGDPRYNWIRNYAQPHNYVYYDHWIVGCDPGSAVYYQWNPHQSKRLLFRAEQHGERLAFRESKNNHTPYYRNGLMCANGRTVHDPNKHFVHRILASGAEAASPYRFYPLDSSTSTCDVNHTSECGTSYKVQYTTDRFGRAYSAMYFNDDGYVILPQSVFNAIRANGDFSVSFWVKKNPDEIVTNAANFYPAETDFWEQIFWAKSDEAAADLGLALHHTGNFRHITGSSGHFAFSKRTKIGNRNFSWRQWMEEPTRLSWKSNARAELSPWTLIVATFSDERTSLYLYNEKMFQTGPVANRIALRRYTFMKLAPARLAAIMAWGLGKTPGSSQKELAAMAIDDFAVFKTELTEEQIRDLMNAQIVGQGVQLAQRQN